MADMIYFSNTIDENGELRLVRQVQHTADDPAPVCVDIVIHDDPLSEREYLNNDPTLAQFYERKKDEH